MNTLIEDLKIVQDKSEGCSSLDRFDLQAQMDCGTGATEAWRQTA